nr:phage portal protein [uncultured Capnocytophaga sp.]
MLNISLLKSGRNAPLPNPMEAQKALNPALHPVNDPVLRRDKQVQTTEGVRMEPVARIALPLQQLIIKRSVAFLFGKSVRYECASEDKQEQQAYAAILKILTQAKDNSPNRRIARATFSFGECAELWYPVPTATTHYDYGFPCQFKLRCSLFSPAFGDTLYPYFDQTGDMTAFSRAYKSLSTNTQTGVGELTDYFETYTATHHYLWRMVSGQYLLEEGYPKPNPIGKIPVVYAHQPHRETEEVDPLIERLEHLLSNFAETNDYHAAPKLFVTGHIQGWSQKGEPGAIIEGDKDASMQYISWHNAPESVKLEMDTLLRMIYTLTQTPDISYQSIRSMSPPSGAALKLLFLDASLKVQDKREIFDAYLARRLAILKAYLPCLHTPLRQAAATVEITAHIQELI